MRREADIQKACLQWLAASGIFHWRNNTGAVRSEYQGRKRFTRFGVPGAPDIMAIRRGEFWGIECKRPLGPKGGAGGSVLTPEQTAFGESIIDAGGHYIVVRSIEELVEKMTINAAPPQE